MKSSILTVTIVKVLAFWAILILWLIVAQKLFHLQSVTPYLLLLLVVPYAILFLGTLDRKSITDLGLKAANLHLVLFGIGIAVFIHVVMILIFAVAGWLVVDGILPQAFSQARIVNLLYGSARISILATLCTGIAEELFFTYPAGSISRVSGKTAGMIAWAVIVFVTHMSNPNSGANFIPISIAGAVLWITAYTTTGSLWTTIGLHWAHNFILGGIFSFPVSGYNLEGFLETTVAGPAWLTGGVTGPEGGLVLPLVFMAAAVLFRRLYRPPAFSPIEQAI